MSVFCGRRYSRSASRAMHKIISYLLIPDFYLQLHLLYYPCDRGVPLLIGGSADDYGLVLEVSEQAREMGIRPGMRSSDAAGRCPSVKIVAPDRMGCDDFSRRVLRIASFFSLKCRKDRYNAFYLFLPDYFHMASSIRSLQKELKNNLGLVTRLGTCVNQRAAKLAARAAGPDQVIFLDRQNAADVFKGKPVTLIGELTLGQAEKLRLAGIRTIPDLLSRSLSDLYFILGKAALSLHRDYLEQLKTVRDEDPFHSEEILLSNAENDTAVLKKKLAEKIGGLLVQAPSAIRVRIQAEYVDQKCLFWSGPLEGQVTAQAVLEKLMKALSARKRRVRIRKMRIGVLPSPAAPLALPAEWNTI